MFGSWLDVISHRRPRLPKRGRATVQVRLSKGIENRAFKQIQNFFRPNAWNGKWTRFCENNFWG